MTDRYDQRTRADRRWRARWWLVLLVALAHAQLFAAPGAWRAECMGYYTMLLPGPVEYALQPLPWPEQWAPRFADGLGVWRTDFFVDSGGTEPLYGRVEISAAATQRDLIGLVERRNASSSKTRSQLLADADRAGKSDRPLLSASYARKASAIRLYERDSSGRFFASRRETTHFYALVGDRIISATNNNPEIFLSNFHSRSPFETPSDPGVCLPYATITGERQPANVGITLRLQERPEIVVYLHDGVERSTSDRPASPQAALSKVVRQSFYGAESFFPLDGGTVPFRSIVMDGRRGASIFGRVTRKLTREEGAADSSLGRGEDWVFAAAVLRDNTAPEGTSSDALLIVERYSHLAKTPMSEQEFRELSHELARSLKRRSGAFIAR